MAPPILLYLAAVALLGNPLTVDTIAGDNIPPGHLLHQYEMTGEDAKLQLGLIDDADIVEEYAAEAEALAKEKEYKGLEIASQRLEQVQEKIRTRIEEKNLTEKQIEQAEKTIAVLERNQEKFAQMADDVEDADGPEAAARAKALRAIVSAQKKIDREAKENFGRIRSEQARAKTGSGKVDMTVLAEPYVEDGSTACTYIGGTLTVESDNVGCTGALLPLIQCSHEMAKKAKLECARIGGAFHCDSKNVYCTYLEK